MKAWYNGKNATVTDTQLRIEEPVEVRVEVISKINGDISLKLKEPGTTKAFTVQNGPSNLDEWIDTDIEVGSLKEFKWIIAPNGAWKNGNAPLNIFVQFNKGNYDKKIQFTIANPYILDEQYSGAVSTLKPTSSSMETATSTPAKAVPFPSALIAFGMLLLAVCKIRR